MQKLILAALLAGVSNVASARLVYYVDLSSQVESRITSFAIAPSGSDRFHAIPIRVQQQGAGDIVTVAIREGDGDCLRDLRIGFADGHRIVRRDFDVCKLGSIQVGDNLLLAAQP